MTVDNPRSFELGEISRILNEGEDSEQPSAKPKVDTQMAQLLHRGYSFDEAEELIGSGLLNIQSPTESGEGFKAKIKRLLGIH